MNLSQIYLTRKQKFFCYVANADENDPIREVTFEDRLKLIQHRPRRVGRPKSKWAETEMIRLL